LAGLHAVPSLLSIRGCGAASLDEYLNRARSFRTGGRSPDRAGLQVNLFFEASTRTRTSFEVAGRRLGLGVVNLEVGSSSVSKGESLADTVRTIDAMQPDVVIVRHSRAGAAEVVAANTGASVINAGDGAREHPTQAVLDAMTLMDRFRSQSLADLSGVSIAVVGDIAHSRVARSNLALWTLAGARVRLVGPRAFLPSGFAESGWDVHHELESGLTGAQVVYLLRVQLERQHGQLYPSMGEYHRRFGLTRERLDRLAPEAVIMHPGPVNRGVEISSDLLADERCLIQDQVANGVWARMAVLDSLLDQREKARR
jgi:aspartate carbamoyltransferase catalytic subunit